MVRSAFSLAMMFMSASTLAQESFIRPHWLGEYPPNFEVRSSVKVPARTSPERATVADATCELRKGARYGHLSKNRDADYFTKGYVTGYVVTNDLDKDQFLGNDKYKGQKIRAGSRVDEMVPWSEGICTVRYEGNLFEANCPSSDEENFSVIEGQRSLDMDHEEWLQLRCPGHEERLWLLMEELEPLFDKGILKLLNIY